MLVGEAVDQVFGQYLEGTFASAYNVLAEPVSITEAPTTTISLQFQTSGPGVGGLIAIDDELMMAVSVSTAASAKQVTVLRGVRGTSIANHVQGALVESNPRFWRDLVRATAYSELQSWPRALYRYEVVRTALGPGQIALQVIPQSQLAVRRVLKVERAGHLPNDGRTFGQSYRTAFNQQIDGDCWVYFDTAIPQSQPFTTNAAGGSLGVVVHLGTDWDLGGAHTWTDQTDLAELGLSDSQVDLLVLGTTWRLVVGREIRRLQFEAQGQNVTAAQEPAGQNAALGMRLKALRDMRIEDEIAKLLDYENRL